MAKGISKFKEVDENVTLDQSSQLGRGRGLFRIPSEPWTPGSTGRAFDIGVANR